MDSLDRQMVIIEGMLRNRGLPGLKLTLVARNPDKEGVWIIRTNDDQAAVADLLLKNNEPPAPGGEAGG